MKVLKIHQSYQYKDLKMGTTVSGTSEIINNNLIHKLVMKHPVYPKIEMIADGMRVSGLIEIEKELKENKDVKDLTFGKELLCTVDKNESCVEIMVN